jgi:serine/threonine-protein kinase 11
MRRFDHPNILKLIEVLYHRDTNKVFLVLEYADSGCLGGFVERGQHLPVPAVLSIIKQVAQAIKYLHGIGYVHHDIKPCNILLDRTGRAILADFGIGHSFVSAAMVVGTPAYQAPECLDDSYDEDAEPTSSEAPQKEDIWALGVTLYQLLFMRLPYQGANLYEIVNAIHEAPMKVPPETDPQIVELLHGMLKIDPADRFLIEDVLKFPPIRDAPDLARGLPPAPHIEIRERETEKQVLDVCPDGFSLAAVALPQCRRRSLIGIDRIPSSELLMSVPDVRMASWGSDENSESLGRFRSSTVL